MGSFKSCVAALITLAVFLFMTGCYRAGASPQLGAGNIVQVRCAISGQVPHADVCQREAKERCKDRAPVFRGIVSKDEVKGLASPNKVVSIQNNVVARYECR